MMEEFGFPIEVVRTNRKKSASIQLEGGLVKVRVPKWLSHRRVRDLISKRTPWIQSKLKQQSLRPCPQAKKYVDGEVFYYLGKKYPLKVVAAPFPTVENPESVASVKLKHGNLLVTIGEQSPKALGVKGLLEHWYQRCATAHLKKRTAQLAQRVGVTPTSVAVRHYKSRWGSCSSHGAITYNWQIMAAPAPVVDYVVVHELCHLLEHNHSPRYWKHVTRHVPDWKDHRAWLRTQTLSF